MLTGTGAHEGEQVGEKADGVWEGFDIGEQCLCGVDDDAKRTRGCYCPVPVSKRVSCEERKRLTGAYGLDYLLLEGVDPRLVRHGYIWAIIARYFVRPVDYSNTLGSQR